MPGLEISLMKSMFVQDFPKLEKQPKWDSKVKPDKVDWDAEIKAAVEKGKDVPEVTWVKPGEDEAMKVSGLSLLSAHACSSLSGQPLQPTMQGRQQA